MVTTVLEMFFMDDQNKEFKLRVVDPRNDISDVEVNEAMDTIIAANAMQSKNGALVSAIGAQIVTRTVDAWDY